MTDNFETAVIVCTGAGNGIGAEVARVLAAKGAAVMAVDLDLAAAENTVASIIEQGGRGHPMAVDVTDPEACKIMADRAVEEFGYITGLYNGAGISDPTLPIHEQSVETWRRVLDINLLGSVFAIQAVTPHLIARGGGSIVNVSSGAGMRATDVGHAPYVSSKHAVVGMTKSAAVDLASHNIRVNAVAPGPTATAMVEKYIAEKPEVEAHLLQRILLNRLGKPREIAAMVSFLLSAEASFCTGAIYEVNGGELAH